MIQFTEWQRKSITLENNRTLYYLYKRSINTYSVLIQIARWETSTKISVMQQVNNNVRTLAYSSYSNNDYDEREQEIIDKIIQSVQNN